PIWSRAGCHSRSSRSAPTVTGARTREPRFARTSRSTPRTSSWPCCKASHRRARRSRKRSRRRSSGSGWTRTRSTRAKPSLAHLGQSLPRARQRDGAFLDLSPRIPIALETPWHGLQRERLRGECARRELVPVERARHRRARQRAHQVRRNRVLPVLVSVHVEEQAATPLLFPKLGRHRLGFARGENLADQRGRL